jgi:general secretion pathway protein H
VRANGFTLVELLVVIAAMGLLASAAVLMWPGAGGGAREAAVRFASRAAAARDEAVLTGQPLGLWVTASGYGFERLRGGLWQPISERPLTQQDWGRGLSADTGGGARRVRFDSVGLPDAPLELAVTAGGDRVPVRIEADGEVRLP